MQEVPDPFSGQDKLYVLDHRRRKVLNIVGGGGGGGGKVGQGGQTLTFR